MSLTRASEIWESYIASQCRCMQETSEREKIPEPFVTISRQTGAGGITIGKKLIQILKEEDKETKCPWTLFDQDLIEKVLEEHHFPRDYAKFMPEDRISEIQDMAEELFGLHPSSWTLVHKTSETILHLARMGNAVLVGRGANVITQKFLTNGFHVRLVCSLEKRIKHVQDYYRVPQDRALEFIKKEDRGRKRYLKDHFNKDIDDPLLYNIVINTSGTPYEDAAKIIGRSVIDLRRQKK